MNQPLGTTRPNPHLRRALTRRDVGKEVVLLGWVHRVRDLGSLVFLDVRDRHGITQVVARDNERCVAAAKRLRPEYVVAVLGKVELRVRPSRSTRRSRPARSRIEAREIRLLNDAKTPPFPIADESPVSEDTRLKYRYLDLRRARHAAQHDRCATARRWRSGSISTSRASSRSRRRCSTKSTPEGARDYLVPSRVHPGEFYALPQSPQIFKQILMICRPRSLLPDRQVLPRRGPARRPAAGVHAGRPRDLVRHRGPRVLDHRAAAWSG